MRLKWTSIALNDLARLYEFLAAVNKPAAARTVQSLTAAPARLLEQPYVGEKLEEFEPREVRRILVGRYEMRYEIQDSTIYCGYGIRAKIGSHVRDNAIKLSVVGADLTNYICFFADA